MPDSNLLFTGFETTIAKVERVGGTAKSSLLKGAVYLRGRLATYPARQSLTRKSVYGSSFQSDRQRRFFFAALRDGRIRVPYVRTRNLGHRWAIKALSAYKVRVGNNAPYARVVMDEAYPQSKFMKALGWKTVQQIKREERKNVAAVIREDLKAQLRQLARK